VYCVKSTCITVHDNATIEIMYFYKWKADWSDEMTRDLKDKVELLHDMVDSVETVI